MLTPAPSVPAAPVAADLFPDLDLGDVRRNRRFHAVVDTLLAGAGAPLPALFPDAAYDACLRLFNAPQATHANILAAHQIAVLQRLEPLTTPVLLLHDATLLDFSGHASLHDDTGPIGNGGGRGWVAHQSLAVDPVHRTVYGLVSQILLTPPKSNPEESVAQRRARKDRHTRLWSQALDEIGPAPATATWIDIMDRGADTFEVLWELTHRRRQFIVRSRHNRALGGGRTDEVAREKLHDRVRSLPALSTWTLEIAGRSGRPPRRAQLAASSTTAVLRPPHVQKGEYPRESLSITLVRVWETDPPAGVVPLEWFLLTNRPATMAAQVREVADFYACRMQIEEFHKAQKTGAAIEGCQFRTGKKMQAFVAVVSVVSVVLLNLRLAGREGAGGELPATSVVPKSWVRLLERIKVRRKPLESVRDFWVHVAWLGGYMKDRPERNPPGWQTLWRGWVKFQLLLQYELSTPKK